MITLNNVTQAGSGRSGKVEDVEKYNRLISTHQVRFAQRGDIGRLQLDATDKQIGLREPNESHLPPVGQVTRP
jgi:hypothetical protein